VQYTVPKAGSESGSGGMPPERASAASLRSLPAVQEGGAEGGSE